jgi:hypothetical protein
MEFCQRLLVTVVNELHSVTALAVSDVLRGCGLVMGLTEEVRKVRLTLAFLPLISIIVSIRHNAHYIIVI